MTRPNLSGTILPSILFEEKIRIPAGFANLAAFRAWARSDDFPRRGRFAFLAGDLFMDMSMERAFTHNLLKGECAEVLGPLIKREQLGYFFHDRMFLTHPETDLATEPDGMFVSFESLERGDAQLVPGEEEGFVEVEGTVDLVLEVVSSTSVRKDTETLRDLYWQAGIPEYWLIDARKEPLRFDILRHGAKGYTATRRAPEGWIKSAVLGRSFRLTQSADPLGNPRFALECRK